MKFQAIINDRVINFSLEKSISGMRLEVDGQNLNTDCIPLTENTYSLIMNGKSYFLTLLNKDEKYVVTVNQQPVEIQMKNERQILLDYYGFVKNSDDHAGEIRAPIPGLVTKYFVKAGDPIKDGDPLFILEAMKMENEISSPVDGVVKFIVENSKGAVEKGDLIMEIKE